MLFNPIKDFGTSAGYIDLLYIDSDYWIYIIEIKLYKSSERRKAISQALDYAASLWCKSEEQAESIIRQIETKIGRKFNDEESRNIKESLMNGNFEIIVAFDKIDDNIKNMIDFFK